MELKNELEEMYFAMNDILSRNNLSGKYIPRRSETEYMKWSELNHRTSELIREFSRTLREKNLEEF